MEIVHVTLRGIKMFNKQKKNKKYFCLILYLNSDKQNEVRSMNHGDIDHI